MKGMEKLLKRTLAAFLAGSMVLSCVSCGLFVNKEEIIEAADAFAGSLIKMNAKKTFKLTTEKKSGKLEKEFEELFDPDNYSSEQNKFIEAVADTITYEILEDTLETGKDSASVDACFTVVDYESALDDEEFENIDSVVDAIEDCDDEEEILVTIELVKVDDSWLVDNMKDKGYKKIFAFLDQELEISPDLASCITYSDLYPGSDYLSYDVLFDRDVTEYSARFSYDVSCEGSLIESDMDPYIYQSEIYCYYYLNGWDTSGNYTVTLKFDGEEIVSDTVYMEVETYSPVYSGQNYGYGPTTINLWTYTSDTHDMIDTFMSLNPDFAADYTVVITELSTYDDSYTDALNEALAAGGENAPDIYLLDSNFVCDYTQGFVSSYAAAYSDLGIDVESEIDAADISQYTVDVGTRNGDVVALSYSDNTNVIIYNRTVANDVFGTDDPDQIEAILGGGTGSWDSFWAAAETCAQNGVSIISGYNDIFTPYLQSCGGWIEDGSLNTDSGIYEFFDLAKDINDNNWSNETGMWYEEWYYDMAEAGDRPVLCFIGPTWLIEYVMAENSGVEYGNWAVCQAPVGSFWGGTWVAANKDTDNADGVAQIIEWMTLDTSESGLQYLLANGLFSDSGIKSAVPSRTVMEASDGSMAYLGGQDPYPYILDTWDSIDGNSISEYDEDLNYYFTASVREYVDPSGLYYNDLNGAISDFENSISILGF